MSRLFPTVRVERAYDITLELLKRLQVRALILDIDNTLTTHGNPNLSERMLTWLEEMREGGIKLMILSNNTSARVEPFAQKVGLAFVANGAKPLGSGFRRCIAALGMERDAVALVGDQLFTDILGGNRFGVKTILVEPMELEQQPFLRFKRVLERRHLRAYRRHLERQQREE